MGRRKISPDVPILEPGSALKKGALLQHDQYASAIEGSFFRRRSKAAIYFSTNLGSTQSNPDKTHVPIQFLSKLTLCRSYFYQLAASDRTINHRVNALFLCSVSGLLFFLLEVLDISVIWTFFSKFASFRSRSFCLPTN